MHLPKKRTLLWVLTLIFTAGCAPAGADFEFGFGTNEIVGGVVVEEGHPNNAPPFVVAYHHHYKFIPFGPAADNPRKHPDQFQSITHPTAQIVKVNPEGKYKVKMPADVVGIELFFIASGRLTQTFSYRRSLGLGKITFNTTLPHNAGYKSHFYTYLQPQLSWIITEKRFKLSNPSLQFLSEWLTQEAKKLQK